LDFDLSPSLPAAGNLAYLDISNNYFDGSLPDGIGQAFPKLSSLFTSNNCLDSYIPDSICQLTNLNTILLDKLHDSNPDEIGKRRNCKMKNKNDFKTIFSKGSFMFLYKNIFQTYIDDYILVESNDDDEIQEKYLMKPFPFGLIQYFKDNHSIDKIIL
jgi:hypothetical protein